MRGKVGKGEAHGTFGELLQGVLPSGQDFLVTFPVDKYSTCQYVYSAKDEDLSVQPSWKRKSLQFGKAILQHYQLPLKGTLFLESQLQQGKGLASSTADMMATVRAIESYYQMAVPPEVIEAVLREIEPSDGLMYPGVVSYYHKEVRLREWIGECPPLTVVALDEGGEVSTVDFNNRPKPFNADEKQEYQLLLEKITAAIRTQDVGAIGEVATRSAEMNQKLHPKRMFTKVREICRTIQGTGVVTAHSGTFIGILISEQDSAYHEKVKEGLSLLGELGCPTEMFRSMSTSERKKVPV
ncbi:kinase [Brevibacillus ruminantium]|uniref:Kinase n=1 Tax=Brevibacillus ruminantium TaxID=2950604 RepID=A0ABY4WIQ7_9BACL|nr:kinase [Brevibacillus ruminantium]USG66584.1 kinase [Brevibacillus ruminantium]